MHIVVIVEGVEEVHDLFAIGFADFGKILGDVTNFSGDDVPTGGLQRLGNDGRGL